MASNARSLSHRYSRCIVINLIQLRHAVAIWREKNFTRAAASLELSQPALTRSIQCLERDLGVQLFDRHARGATPTAFGNLVLGHAEELLAREAQLRREIEQLRTLQAGELRVGAGPYPARTILGPSLAALCSRDAGFRVHVAVDRAERLRDLLLNGEIDLFVGDDVAPRDQRFEVIALKERPTVLYCRSKHPLTTQRALLAADILRYPLGCPTPRREQHDAARTFLEELPSAVLRRTTVYADNIALLVSVVRHSDCVGFATPEAIIDEVRLGQVVILPFRLPHVFGSTLALVKMKNATPSPLAQVFISAIQQHDASQFILEHGAVFAAGD